MYINPKQKRRSIIGNIIVLISMLGMVGGIYWGVQYYTHASKSVSPLGVLVSNITDKSVVITWTTDTSVVGSVKLEDGRVFSDDRGLVSSKTHIVTITGLEPGQYYKYTLISGSESANQDELGNSFQFSTVESDSWAIETNLSGNISSDNIIIIYAKNNFYSALSNSNGDFNVKILHYNNFSFLDTDTISVFLIKADGSVYKITDSFGILFDESGYLVEPNNFVEGSIAEISVLSKESGIVKKIEESNTENYNSSTDNDLYDNNEDLDNSSTFDTKNSEESTDTSADTSADTSGESFIKFRKITIDNEENTEINRKAIDIKSSETDDNIQYIQLKSTSF